MDSAQDVERLFSWLKAPMVHYREFAPQIEVAEAVAAWPAVHKAAVETGLASADQPGPQGDAAAHARVARERMMMPSAAPAPVVHESPAADEPVPEPGLVETLGQRLRAGERAEASMAAPSPVAPPVAPYAAREPEPALMTFEEPAPAAAPPRYRAEPPAQAYAPPSQSAGGLFGGEYRGREREVRSERPVADRRDRSLDAVFSRMAGARDGLPDPRARARTTPGLGAVFGRLR